MKTTNKLAIWGASIVLLCCSTGCLFLLGGASATELPGAVIKLGVPPAKTLEQTFQIMEDAILTQGYTKQPYDDWLTEQPYKKDKFKVFYDPYDNAQRELDVVYLHFKESDVSLFSETGIQEYDQLVRVFASVGLQSEPEDEADRKHARWAATPEMFNHRQQSWPMRIPQITGPLLGLTALLFYGVLILWPGFWVAEKILNYLRISPTWKRILFVVAGTLLAPGLILLTPFGPPLLVPFPLALLFALMAPPLIILLAISLVATAIFSTIVSFRLWGRIPSNVN